MKVQITTKYLHTFIPKRCRKERYETLDVTFPVTIREASVADAPVAFIVRQYGEYPSVVRLYKGKLYRNNFQYAIRYTYEDENNLHRGDTKHDLIPLDKTDWNRLLTRTWGVPNMDEVETKAYSRKRAKDYIIVDNQLYVRTGEPFYEGVTFGLGRNHGGCGFFARFLPTRRMRYGEMYPLSYPATQRKEAIKAILMVAIRRGDNESYNHLLRGGNGDIQVLMPEACKFDFSPLRQCESNTKFPPTEEDYKALEALGDPLPYEGHIAGVLNEDDYKRTEEYISSIV